MAEQVFKNVQVLKGIPVNEFMGTMGVFSAALGCRARTVMRRVMPTGRCMRRTARENRWRA